MNLDQLMAWTMALTRWVHVFAAILWIGQTYLFNFLERNLEREADQPGVEGNVWLVHGGGFFRVQKRRDPGGSPQRLHWFKWEAATTWVSGVVLIALTYYAGGLLVEPSMSYNLAAGTGIGVVIGGWIVYDLLARSPLGRNEKVLAGAFFPLILGVAYLLCRVQSGRSAYMHMGALFGTIMTANVWMRILPSQRRMIGMSAQGEEPDSALRAVGPQRSRHNSYMVVPLVFIMISNHYPTISYGHTWNWVMLGLFVLLGWAAARVMRV